MSSGGASEQERTEAPTPKRRQEARKEGRVPKSAELSGAVMLLGAALMLVYSGGAVMANQAAGMLRTGTGWLTLAPLSIESAQAVAMTTAQAFALAFLPFATAMFILIVAVNLVQTRGNVSEKAISFKFDQLNPVAGFGRLLSVKSVFSLGKSVVKLLVIGLVVYTALHAALPQVIALSSAHAGEIVDVIQRLAFKVTLTGGFAFLVIAAADYAFEVWQYEKSLKMTKQEVIQENKENEGNPLIKSRMRSLGQQLRRKRMLANVKTADVVVTNPTHIAVALKYDLKVSAAPVVVAMGERKLAQRIKQLAKEANVPTVENKPLARALLATAKVGKPIPVDLYTAVAEVLAYIYRRRGWVTA